MLLNEITISGVKLKRAAPEKMLGAGVQGFATKTNKPNTVRKVYGFDSYNDPYYQYIELIRKHQDNPFFPRIYRHTVYDNKSIQISFVSDYFNTGVVMMEKLLPLNSKKLDERIALSLFHNLGIPIKEIIDVYGAFENSAAIQQIINTTTNQQFADALKILLSTGRKAYDLHAGNWMIRLTSTGPQLVILDPMYGSDAASLPPVDTKQVELALDL